VTPHVRQALRMNQAEKRDYPAGTIVNLASVDCDNLMNFSWSSFHDLWACPLRSALRSFILPCVRVMVRAMQLGATAASTRSR
jgi:hypothetical protein